MSETLTEQTYIYQPTDKDGRPIGGKQVIKYTTQDELIAKLQDQNILLIRKLRDETKKVRLGIEEKEDLPDAVKFDSPVEFSPRDLSEEERYELARKLTDPVTASQAAQELVEASLGAPLSKIGETLQSIQRDNIALKAKIEVNLFISENPDYYKCPENFEAISSWMLRYDLAPVKANFQKAYDTLKGQGLLVEGPAPVVPVIVPVETVEVPVIPVPAPTHRIPSGLTREEASDVNTTIGTPVHVQVGSEITYVLNGQTLTGLKAVAAMPSDEYRRRLADKNFAKLVDKLEAEARKPRV